MNDISTKQPDTCYYVYVSLISVYLVPSSCSAYLTFTFTIILLTNFKYAFRYNSKLVTYYYTATPCCLHRTHSHRNSARHWVYWIMINAAESRRCQWDHWSIQRPITCTNTACSKWHCLCGTQQYGISSLQHGRDHLTTWTRPYRATSENLTDFPSRNRGPQNHIGLNLEWECVLMYNWHRISFHTVLTLTYIQNWQGRLYYIDMNSRNKR